MEYKSNCNQYNHSQFGKENSDEVFIVLNNLIK